MNRESIQKWIIIAAATLGLVISTGGLAYRHLLANETTIKPNPASPKASQASISDTNNFYAKIKSGQPVNILFLGEENARNQLFLDQFQKDLTDQFTSIPSLSSLATVNGTSWSNLMALQKNQQTQQPDLVLICSGANDEKELSPEQYKALYEATLQALGKQYPNTEIMLVQEPTLSNVTVEIHRKLANYYNLPLLAIKDPAKATAAPEAPMDIIQEKLKTNASPAQLANKVPLWDIEKYQTWQQLQTYSQVHEMEQPKDAENANTLESSKEGAFAESTFQGRCIGLNLQCGPDGGVARIFIDGKKHSEINTYSSKPGVLHLLLADNLAPGEHRIQVMALGFGKIPSSGSKVVLQGFDVME